MPNRIGFEIVLLSDKGYEKLVAEIHFDGHLFATVSKAQNGSGFRIETPGAELLQSLIVRSVEWEGLKRAVEEACTALLGRDSSGSS